MQLFDESSFPSPFRFQKACVKYGVPDVDLFQTTDLFDRKNIALVTTTVFAVGRAVGIIKFGFTLILFLI